MAVAVAAATAAEGKGTYEDNFEQHLLVNLHELLIPFFDIASLATVVILVSGGGGVVLVVLAPLDNLAEDSLVNLRGISLALFRSATGRICLFVC